LKARYLPDGISPPAEQPALTFVASAETDGFLHLRENHANSFLLAAFVVTAYTVIWIAKEE